MLRDFSRDGGILNITEDEFADMQDRYLSCVVMQAFPTELRKGANHDSPLVHRFHGFVSAGPVHIAGVKVVYHADGVDDDSIVFTETARVGHHSASAEATAAALKNRCNLNDHFGEEKSTGFTGWFYDTGLTSPYGGSELTAGEELHLYGRNRCTVRIDYAEGSLHPEEGAVYRTAASDGAPEVPGALELPDYSKGRESHSLGGITLPAIGDDGRAHKAVYWGERVAPAKPEDVYRKTSDGTWRRYVPMCWLTSAGELGESTGSITAKRDTVLYIKWSLAQADGVVSSK